MVVDGCRRSCINAVASASLPLETQQTLGGFAFDARHQRGSFVNSPIS